MRHRPRTAASTAGRGSPSAGAAWALDLGLPVSVRAARPAGSSFDYGGPLTEIGLLGAIAFRFPGEELRWDAEQARFTNRDAANAYVAPATREGWGG